MVPTSLNQAVALQREYCYNSAMTGDGQGRSSGCVPLRVDSTPGNEKGPVPRGEWCLYCDQKAGGGCGLERWSGLGLGREVS
jgi:hypothetical protein